MTTKWDAAFFSVVSKGSIISISISISIFYFYCWRSITAKISRESQPTYRADAHNSAYNSRSS